MRIIYHEVFYDNEKKEKYKIRLSGLISSILGKKSYKRINSNNL